MTIRIFLLLAIVLITSCHAKREPVELVIIGGTIYTSDDKNPVVEAVAVNADTIVYAGTEAGVQTHVGKHTKIIDLEGKTMTPGFIEGHGHLMSLGYNELNVDLSGVTSYEQMVNEVKRAVDRAVPGQWIEGRGWHQDKWNDGTGQLVKGFPTHEGISAVSPDNPVFLRHASGHAGLANEKAMELAGIYALTVNNAGRLHNKGEVIRDMAGHPTGIFNERAQELITKFIPANTKERDLQALELALSACLKNGITSFHDAGVSQEEINLFSAYKSDGKLGVRLYVMIDGGNRDLFYRWMKRGPLIDPEHWLTVRAVKLSCDGALGSRGAWLLEPYSDRPGHDGHETLPMDTVYKTSLVALEHGFQVCAHAIGDRANREVLDQYEHAFDEAGSTPSAPRFRIEHAQHLDAADIPRFGELGVIAAMQAIHMSSDRPWAIERLGETRIAEGAYVWQKLLNSGAVIVNGTDAPVEPLSPVAGFYASVSRKTLAGKPEGGFEPDQKMTREQALRSYTLDAAYAAFEEDIKGSIEPGKLADFTIFTRDIMTIDEDDILSTEVAMTIVGGKVAYKK
ncbi:MAG TPA: amidohydrolase [Cyclobacteriaceae bacterium]|nr:amidohydrolase [Cyclobacteriaceae bacterium]